MVVWWLRISKSPCNSGDSGFSPGQGAKISAAVEQLSPPPEGRLPTTTEGPACSTETQRSQRNPVLRSNPSPGKDTGVEVHVTYTWASLGLRQ